MSKKPAGKPGMDTEMKYVTMKIVGGEAPSNAILSAKLSPFGCNPNRLEKKFLKTLKNIQIFIFMLN